MPTTDLTQPINRGEARLIALGCNEAAALLRNLIERAQGNGHDDAPDYLDDALALIGNASDSIIGELDDAS
jgi:hypothetical protein